MALSLRSTPTAGQDPPTHHHRPQRQRKRPEMYGFGPTTHTEAHMYRAISDSNQESDADSVYSDSGASTSDDEEQQQALEQNISQPAAAAAAAHAAPSAKRRRCKATGSTGSHSVLQLPDGGRAVSMAWRISEASLFVGVALARTCPSIPHTMMLLLTVDGVPAGVPPQAVTLKITGVNAKLGPRYMLSAHMNVMRNYIGYTMIQLTINSRSTEMTAHLQSPEARNRAEADEAEALNAAAAAIIPGNWVEALGSGVVLRKHTGEIRPPAALLRHAFGTPAEYPLKCILGLFLNESLIGRTYRTMKFHNTRRCHSIYIPTEYMEQVRGSGVVKFRAAAPNLIEVYFRTPTSSAPAPTAPPTPLLNIGTTPVSAPPAAAAANQHIAVVEVVGEVAAMTKAAAARAAASPRQQTGSRDGPDRGSHDSAAPKAMLQVCAIGPPDAVDNTTGRHTTSATAAAPPTQPRLHDGLCIGSHDSAPPNSMKQVSGAGFPPTVNNMTARRTASVTVELPKPQPGSRGGLSSSSHGSEFSKSMLPATATGPAAAVCNTSVKRTAAVSALEDARDPTQPVATLSRRRLNTAMPPEPLGGHSNVPMSPVGVIAGGHPGSLPQHPSPGGGFHATNNKATMDGSSKPRSEGRFTAAATKPIKREQQVQQSTLPPPPQKQQQQHQHNATTSSAAQVELIDLVSSDGEAEVAQEAVGTGPHSAAVGAALLPQAEARGSLGFRMEPYASVEQACKQLVTLLDRLSAPDDLMKQLQVVLLKLYRLGDQKIHRKRIEVFEAQYSLVGSWVGRGKPDLALAAVKELLDTAVAEAN